MNPEFPIAQYLIGDHRNYVYAILDWKTRSALVVDPHRGMEPVFSDLEHHGFSLKGCLITHSHWDHILGVDEVATRCPGVLFYVHPSDRYRIRELKDDQISRLNDGESLTLLPQVQIDVWHTPGHSAGECSFLVEKKYLLTGDTLFIRDCGRTDLETGSNAELFASLVRIKSLPKETRIFPGHQYSPESSETLERMLEINPALRCDTLEAFSALP